VIKAVNEYIAKKIAERKEKNAFRELSLSKDLIDFCSNDYLGFARDKNLAILNHQCLMDFEDLYNGSTGARTITGTNRLTIELESMLSDFHRSPAALIYNSGYIANLGLFSSLPYRGDLVLYDELIHASIRDGIQMSRADAYSFKHNDLVDLENKLKRASGKVYVAVEAIYSMDGDQAPLIDLVEVCKKYDAALIVDEAHSNGVLGAKGEGLVADLCLEKDVFARVITFGKALGCHGAAVLGSQDLKDFLVNYSRPFIYTTAPAPHMLISIKNAYDKLSKSKHKILNLRDLINYFKLKIQDLLDEAKIESSSPIQCLIIPGNDRVKAVCRQVQALGLDVRPIVAPTVPAGKERIRICLHSYNTKDEVDRLVDALKKSISINERG
jgi:8-amino-7-oxononanoate synthase